jgi:hypothetical protein
MSTLRLITAPFARQLKAEHLASDLVYQGMTIIAVLWLLASLWSF